MGVAGCNRVMAFACIVCTIGSDATKQLIRSDLIEQVGKHRRIANAAARDFDRAYLQRLLINPYVYLAP